ncbi:MAG: hypothetical protein ACRDHZ_14910, partial [Ktedonobacteraceae bacterium]
VEQGPHSDQQDNNTYRSLYGIYHKNTTFLCYRCPAQGPHTRASTGTHLAGTKKRANSSALS